MTKHYMAIALLFFVTNALFSQSVANTKPFIQNEKIGEFTVDVLKGDDDYAAIVHLNRGQNAKPFIYQVEVDFKHLKSASEIVKFEDLNFDGVGEIKIYTHMRGFYIYDRTTGAPKNLFSGAFTSETPTAEEQNFVLILRGDYEVNKKDKTIKISGSCGAGCGSEELYMPGENGTMKLVEKKEWNYML